MVKIGENSYFKLIAQFCNIIPDDALIQCISKLLDNTNRENKRKISRINSLNKKIDEIINGKYTSLRNHFIKLIFEYYWSDETEQLDVYENMIKKFNQNNCIKFTVFILYKCLTDKEYNKEYFTKFLLSEQFKKTLRNQWKDENLLYVGIDNENSNSNNHVGGDNMKTYLGIIELNGTYYNFKPQYIYDEKDKHIIYVSGEEVKISFPNYGSINLSYVRNKESERFLENLNLNERNSYFSKNFNEKYKKIFAVSFSESEISDNDNERILKKIDLQNFVSERIKLNDRIKDISELGIYKIVKPAEEISYNSFISSMIAIDEEYDENDLVLLDFNGDLYGPYKLAERAYDGLKYIKPDASTNKYIVNKYENEMYRSFDFVKETHTDILYTTVAILLEKPQPKDVISDEILMENLQNEIDISLIKQNPAEFVRTCEKSPFLANIPNEIREQRLTRIESILSNYKNYSDAKNNALISLLEKESISKLLGDKIKETDDYKAIVSENADLCNENKKLIEENNRLKTDLQDVNNNSSSNGVIPDDYEFIKNENENLKKTILGLKTENKELESLKGLVSKRDEIKEEIKNIEPVYNHYYTETDKLKSKVIEAITSGKNEASIAFDPYISNKMLKAAAQWDEEDQKAKYLSYIDQIKSIKIKEHEKEDLIRYLVETVQKYRNYSKNEIINMYICIAQNFITIFSGDPGTGKTSICNIISASLGLTNDLEYKRYIPVSVERGWSSKRDLIGYFNPITKKYDKSNGKIYDALQILNLEKNESRIPFIILLDEANLSPVEYYWADFMRLTDTRDFESYINIGTENDIFIPNTLRFLATINNDQTTENLSPRLIDRAWIIKMPVCDIKENDVDIPNKETREMITQENINKAFANSESKTPRLSSELNSIYDLFRQHNLPISPRIQQSIKRYICVAQEIMDDEANCRKDQKALDYAILQKLLPKINGLVNNYSKLFDSLLLICENNSLHMTKQAIEEMIEMADRNMGYCQYLS